MYKRSKTTLVVMIALVWLFLICLMSQATAEVTASIRTAKAKFFRGEEISTWITLRVSEDVITDADFFQKKFERQLDVRDPNKERAIPKYYETNPGQNEPPPPPPDIPKIVLKAGDYEVVIKDLAEHYSISEIGLYTVRFVTPMRIHASSPKVVEISSKADTFEIVEAGRVAVDVVPATLSLRSKIKWIIAFVSAFPEGQTAADVKIGSVKLRHNKESISAESGDVQGSVLMVRFNGAEVQNMLSPAAEIELEVTGNFRNLEPFRGSDTIRVIE